MAGDDVTKIEEIENQPLEKCLLLLAFRQDKLLVEDLMHKESLMKMNQ